MPALPPNRFGHGWAELAYGRKLGTMPYLDHAATTPMLPEAVTAVSDALGELGNPSSLHGAGRRARRRIEESREQLAAALRARPSEVIFTAGGTEADNLAVKGLYWARRQQDPRRTRVLVSSIEHHAVLDSAEWLGTDQGAEVVLLPVDELRRASRPTRWTTALADDPAAAAVVSVMWANNEVGTVQPIAELAAVAQRFGVPVPHRCGAGRAVAAGGLRRRPASPRSR